MRELNEDPPNKSTGPRTFTGKETSSQNRLTHGCRSKRIIVGDERQEDFDALDAGWREEFEMEGQAGKSLLKRVILNDWLLQRAEGHYLGAQEDVAMTEPAAWTEEQHKKVQLFLRYKTTAERSFYRAYNALKELRKDKVREELQMDKVREKIEKFVEEAATKAEARKADTVTVSKPQPQQTQALRKPLTQVQAEPKSRGM